ncbi:MAG: nucleotidyltransferase domain-containing protein [Deltaproteobacteria bacterium]|nr:nucleotidyltransferase domain-containing protein [Deltaproteobacteria bacterium]
MAIDFDAVKKEAIRFADMVRSVMEVDRVILFGSYANGTAGESSDVDIAVFVGDHMIRRRREIGGELCNMTRYFDIDIEPHVIPSAAIKKAVSSHKRY